MKLNLINPENSDIKYTIFSFPDGEKQISIDSEIDRKQEIKVICRVTNADELFILMQINDILSRHGVKWSLYITYLMSARMDRVMDFNRPFSLSIVGNIISNFSSYSIEVLEPHSERVADLANSYSRIFINNLNSKYFKDATVVYPDKGSAERYQGYFYTNTVIFKKKRNLETGKIESFEIEREWVTSRNFVFIDDLCDGGGTFLGELEVLKEKYPDGIFTLIVCHAVNEQGLRKVLDKFDRVIISNSYRDWDKIITSDKLIVEKVW